MGLMTHANTPERRQQAIEELRREEAAARRMAIEASKRNALNALRLTNEWRALRDELEALEQAEAVRILAGDVPECCSRCRRRFDRYVVLCRASVSTWKAACTDCAPDLDQIARHIRQAVGVAA